VTDIPQRPVLAGRVRIRFLVKKNIARAPTVAVRTETGTIQVSTPEAMGGGPSTSCVTSPLPGA